VKVRNYRPGDEARQGEIYNAAAARLPGFKLATDDELRRRVQGRDFDPATRFYAEDGGKIVAYATFQSNGRASYPWTLPGHESAAEPLFEAVLHAMRERRLPRAFAAYRGDWAPVAEFFSKHGFAKAREMVNFYQLLTELPTMVNRRSLPVTKFYPTDLPALVRLVPGLIRMPEEELEAHFFLNPRIAGDALYALRRQDGSLNAVGIIVSDERYANVTQVDSKAPCFRLGAFGTEGMSAKRINGLFSFVAAPGKEATPLGLDLLWYATLKLQDSPINAIAAQVPSDVPHLLSFYQKYFRHQDSFPIYERSLA
jgi:hypothetical protein